ncbi:O-antigen polysaccharide polymerase Wzy family protein [Aerococcus viridans]|uniref:O-antigen polysaccharide polymerase Wzy family protein n=1 Tax=Aerococcus viridans TaxID=1377 RepID=UPI003B226290
MLFRWLSKLILPLFSVLFLFMITFSLFLQNLSLGLISCILLVIMVIIFGFNKFNSRITLILFSISYFVFLLGGLISQLFTSNGSSNINFTPEVLFNTTIISIVALLSILVGFVFSEKSFVKKDETLAVTNDSVNKLRLKKMIGKVSLGLFFISLFPTLYLVMDKIIFLSGNLYTDLYLNYSGVPIIIERFGQVFKVSFYTFLSTLPTKKEARLPIFCYLGVNILNLFTGQRATTVIAFLVIFFYFVYRNKIAGIKFTQKGSWISQTQIVILTLSSPIIIAALAFINYIRDGKSYGNFNISSLFLEFFEKQGGSVNLISYAQTLNFPSTNSSYTLGPLINLVRNSVFVQSLTDIPPIVQQTVYGAMYGNNFAYTVSYLVIPRMYLNGGGLGSSYLAELYVDFGMVSIIIFNLLIGIILNYISNYKGTRSWMLTIMLLMFETLLFMPRSSALGFITSAFNATTLLTLFVIYLLAELGMKIKEFK